MRTKPCSHLLAVKPGPVPEGGCADCLATGGSWVHLRLCTTCGEIRCCDDSPNQHASRHAAATEHPVIRSAEPGESWAFCYEHNTLAPDVTTLQYYA